MKKVILIVVALVALQMTAQEKKEGPNKERGEKMEHFKDMTPEEMATLQTKKMTLHLDLNASQQREIQQLNLQNATERKAKMEAHKALKESGKMEKPSKEDRLKMMNEHLDYQIAMKAKMKTILNADQYAKWEKDQEKMKNKHSGKQKHKGDKK
tara:strand:- start:7765 stop:8226 length:462 start_codon:yes stop_codon:yes gene_type:complete